MSGPAGALPHDARHDALHDALQDTPHAARHDVPHPTRPAVRLLAKAADAGSLALRLEPVAPPVLPPGHALVQVRACGVNPSDVKAALGLMPQAMWPRTPGRDYAGVVVEGPSEWLGRAVWGSGGDLGITRDGSHAGWLTLPPAALRAMPQRLSFDEAGSVGVPFVTAYEGLRRAGLVQRGQVVAVMGANGKVGQAAVQLARQAGAHVVAVQRGAATGDNRGVGDSGRAADVGGDSSGGSAVDIGSDRGIGVRHGGDGSDGRGDSGGGTLTTVDARTEDVVERIRAAGHGRGADIVFNTVGSPYFESANRAMAKGATQVFIATVERPVSFDIFTFYRGMHTYVGIDTLALDCGATAERIDAMAAGFDAGRLRPFAVAADATYALADAATAYRRVIGGDAARVVLRP